jgi:hypothetical protein
MLAVDEVKAGRHEPGPEALSLDGTVDAEPGQVPVRHLRVCFIHLLEHPSRSANLASSPPGSTPGGNHKATAANSPNLYTPPLSKATPPNASSACGNYVRKSSGSG